MIKKYLPFLCFVLLFSAAEAQSLKMPKHQRWELGLLAGAAQGQTDLSGIGLHHINPGGGFLLRYHLDDITALRLNAVYAEITGDDANHSNYENRAFRFSAPLTETSIVVELDLLGKRRWNSNGEFQRTVSPYIFGGVGYAFTQPSTDYNESENGNLRDLILIDRNQVYDGHVVAPIGVGIKIDASENWILGFETGVRVLFNDYLDGISHSANPLKNDTYSLATMSATYRISYTADRDRDGIPDKEDACPDAKGTEDTRGCPDSDSDGIADNADACPNSKGNPTNGGCPDSDSDGVADNSDQCPDQKGTPATAGCPDSDGDGLIDSKDACPEVAGLSKLNGCPDQDGDSIADAVDQCPERAGDAANNGCPANDRDRDGVIDGEDRCPDTAGPASFSGCPDSDRDGLADHLDSCPDLSGLSSNAGCPGLGEEDEKVLANAMYGVQFESGKSTIKSVSLPILDQVAVLMTRFPNYHLTISGHTDSAGSESTNQQLSESRSRACLEYLATKGVAATRMTNIGYGETQPIAENNTPAGKAANRRVVFEMKISRQ